MTDTPAAGSGQTKQLLSEVLHVLEWATFHDGRYGQEQDKKFQDRAQALVKRIAPILGRKPYQDMGPK